MSRLNIQEDINLKEVYHIIRKRILIVLIFPLLAVICSWMVSSFYLQPVYNASTTLMLWKSYTADQPVAYQDLQINHQLVSTYQEIARSRLVSQEAINNLEISLSPDQFSKKVDVSLVGETGIISISVRDGDPDKAAVMANEVAEVFKDQVPRTIQLDNVQIIDRAVPPSSPILPRTGLNVLVSGILGLVMGSGLAFVYDYFDDSLDSIEEVYGLKLNILSIIPEATERSFGNR
ncbi:MAG: capsular biosynthesis protein [Candidatus Syntrophonatronum acetioxidans]|uniref:Capsular biosynthesis protein n=1 Tax=Candidatus Syntrophonatronum acetioxidans TaxID=1795816 RepID=A0A424YCD4_9FIRM|nr:MAG: capsular biosynthesis protein [Candidatus Syntrophonatronum acetioxidans]